MPALPRALALLVAAFLASGLTAARAGGPVSFGPPRLFDAHDITTSRTDGEPALAGDGAGNWVAVWHSNEDLGIGAGFDFEPLVATSSDDGATWSAASVLKSTFLTDSSPGNNDIAPRIATDGTGTWVTVWNAGSAATLAEDCFVMTLSDIQVARSTDNGATWSPEAVLNSNAGGESNVNRDRCPQVATGNGVWIVAWSSDSSLGGALGADFDDMDILMSRSTDGGVTWSAAAPLNTDAATDSDDDFPAALATDGAGNWVASWSRRIPAGRIAVVSTSGDDGLTWTAPVQVSDIADGKVVPATSGVATDGAGNWVATWSRAPDNSVFLAADDVYATRSIDNGATWSVSADAKPDPVGDNQFDYHPHVTAVVPGVFLIAFGTSDPMGSLGSNDGDIVAVLSEDGGATWGAPEGVDALGVGDPRDDEDEQICVAGDGTGTVMAAWRSRRVYGAGTGLDNNGTIHASRSVPDCPAAPAAGCRQVTDSRRSRLKIVDKDGAGDTMLWKWTKGEETLLGDFGDPVATSDHVLCLYETVLGVPALRFEEDVEAGGACGVHPCWIPSGSRFRYVDKPIDRGATRKLDLFAGAEGRAKVVWNARQAMLGPPAPPFDPTATVTVQLHNLETGLCQEAAFSTPKRNEPGRYDARSD